VVNLYRRERLRNYRYSGFLLSTSCLINRPEGYGLDTLRHYTALFPHEILAKLIQAYLVYMGVPLSDDDETTTTRPGSLDDVFGVISVCSHFIHIPLALYQT
jgi:hypothetical protein